MYYEDGRKYKGRWEDGLYHGQGILYNRDGSVYLGHFYKGLKHGKGILLDNNNLKTQFFYN